MAIAIGKRHASGTTYPGAPVNPRAAGVAAARPSTTVATPRRRSARAAKNESAKAGTNFTPSRLGCARRSLSALFLFRWFPKTDVQSTSYEVMETIRSQKFSKLRRDMFAMQHMGRCTCPHMTVITRHAKVHQIATEHDKCILSRV